MRWERRTAIVNMIEEGHFDLDDLLKVSPSYKGSQHPGYVKQERSSPLESLVLLDLIRLSHANPATTK